MYVNKKSNVPVYLQLKRIVLDKIESGEYKPDKPIPSERELGDSIEVSRMTVRQALNQLVTEGVLYREKGRGTFVSQPKFEQRSNLSFSEIVRQRGMEPGSQILYFKREQPPVKVAEQLEIGGNEQVYLLKRLRLANDKPVGIEQEYIPDKYCLGLDRFDLTGSLYRLLKDEFSYVIAGVDYTIEAARAREEEKEILKMPSGIPVLIISGVYYTDMGLKLYYEKSVFRSDEYRYSAKVPF